MDQNNLNQMNNVDVNNQMSNNVNTQPQGDTNMYQQQPVQTEPTYQQQPVQTEPTYQQPQYTQPVTPEPQKPKKSKLGLIIIIPFEQIKYSD